MTPGFEGMFGTVPGGAPSELIRYNRPATLFDILKAVENEGRLTRDQKAIMFQQLIRQATKAPDLKWGTLLGGGVGSGLGYLTAKHLSNLGPHGQMGGAAVGGGVGALIGNLLQRVKFRERLDTEVPDEFL